MTGHVHVYTGEGKGKTTAALGLALRAAGAGWRVFVGQFIKGHAASELDALERLADLVTVRQFGGGGFVCETPGSDDTYRAACGLIECKEAILSGDYALVVLDEANVALALGLFSLDDLLEVIDARPERVELVITGRYAHSAVLNRADLVTEMREVKHYYQSGVEARAGIEK